MPLGKDQELFWSLICQKDTAPPALSTSQHGYEHKMRITGLFHVFYLQKVSANVRNHHFHR